MAGQGQVIKDRLYLAGNLGFLFSHDADEYCHRSGFRGGRQAADPGNITGTHASQR
jgi:hypothetical protein